jgi:adenosine deaminase
VYAITYDSLVQLKHDGIFFIEIRFSPEHFALFNNFDRMTVTRTVIEAGNKAALDTGVGIRYLITFNRSKQEEAEMIALYRKILELKNPWIVGIDLAGDELNYSAGRFKELFSIIRIDGIYMSTIHAGEVTPAAEIWSAIKSLNAARIGHGTSAINDRELQKYLTDHGIVLEQCLTSNYQTGSWADESTHPVGRLFRAGVPVTLNSDDPTIEDTDLSDDYVKAVRYFGFSLNDFVRLNLNALNATFLPTTERSRLITNYLAAVENFRKETTSLAGG